MYKKLFSIAITAATVTACAVAGEPNYKVTVNFPDDSNDDAMAYILDYDSGEKVDSTIVAESAAVFSGNISAPIMARIIVDGNRGPMFILEQADINVNGQTGETTGGTLNTRLESIGNEMQSIVAQFQALPQDSASAIKAQELESRYMDLQEKAFKENADNPIGLYFFLQNAYELDLPALDAELKQYPSLASSARVQKLRESLLAKKATSEGARFKDFEISYNGKTSRLSDYVGKGKYTLVDFWASWCGPCIREISTIKNLYSEFHDKGLDVLGVAVWDEPAATEAAIAKHQIPWPVIINGQNIPTDIYGISGIPCIILFDPEGKIVSRDQQGQALVNTVTRFMTQTE